MPDKPTPPPGEIVLYQTEDGRTRVECRFADETLWLSQALMAELFQVTPQNITLHLQSLYQEGEISEPATCKEFLQVRMEGARRITRSVKYYSLDAILSVGYRALLEAEGERAAQKALEDAAKTLPEKPKHTGPKR